MLATETYTEWEFTADVASWINELLQARPALPFSRAKCEKRVAGSQKRNDLTLLDEDGRIALTGEVKLPYRPDGGSPYNSTVIRDARSKAIRNGVRFFFTWNVNEFALWETEPTGPAWKDRSYRSWKVTDVHRPEQLVSPPAQHAIQAWLQTLLDEFAAILRGTDFIAAKAPDEQFIELLESSLETPIRRTYEELLERYEDEAARSLLDEWMRDELGFIITDDQAGIEDNLDRAARFACYNLINKLVFYDALLTQHQTELPRLKAPPHIDTGEALRTHLERYFADAKQVTGDYETVFGEDHLAIGNRVPFYSDHAVPHWKALIEDINEFDFTKLDYEVIGGIFERLISPEERHKYGQFYTRVEVVDLINSFCIRTGAETVMDPACGGGTFLVRAYARKSALAPGRRHRELLSDLYGIDISDFATHLTTINLATRELVDQQNYPQVARADFFDVRSEGRFLRLPTGIKADGLGSGQKRQVYIEPINAVVGNPPYIRQEDIPKQKKDRYNALVEEEADADLSKRSDIHCYFWPHASSFLAGDGYLCFLTSSQWLDTSYGFKLQNWVLQNFEVRAILESVVEPWFVGARVATTITILRRQSDEAARMSNVVRFVQLRRPLKEIMAHDNTVPGAMAAADRFRDELMGLTDNTLNERYRARLVPQAELWDEGVRLGAIMGRGAEKPEDADELDQAGTYYGGKWGVHVRAPDLWFELLDGIGDRMRPLGEIAHVWRGITTGKDAFFFPIDAGKKCLKEVANPVKFEARFGVPRHRVASGEVKLVRCGAGRGEIRPIESRYLEPEVHSLMEVHGFTVGPEDCRRLILLVGAPPDELEGTYVLDYIRWGEEQGWHRGATCASRATETRQWYDLTGHERGELFWPMAQQYKHAVPRNEHGMICNHNLFDVSPNAVSADALAGVLNSTLTVLSKYQYGRPVGVEGNLKTEVVDVNMMLVPEPTGATDKQRGRVAAAFRAMKDRKVLQFLSERRLRRMSYVENGRESELNSLSDKTELDMADRRELDDAVLEMMGIASEKRRRDIIEELYDYLREFFEMTRRKEEHAIRNKKRASRRGRRTPMDIAEQILDWLEEHEPQWLRRYDPDFLPHDEPYDTWELPAEGKATLVHDVFDGYGVRFTKAGKEKGFISGRHEEQHALIAYLANRGLRGLVRVPVEAETCAELRRRYADYLTRRTHRLWELIEARTADEDTQKAVYKKLYTLVP